MTIDRLASLLDDDYTRPAEISGEIVIDTEGMQCSIKDVVREQISRGCVFLYRRNDDSYEPVSVEDALLILQADRIWDPNVPVDPAQDYWLGAKTADRSQKSLSKGLGY
jgi:hypothetical protein